MIVFFSHQFLYIYDMLKNNSENVNSVLDPRFIVTNPRLTYVLTEYRISDHVTPFSHHSLLESISCMCREIA